MTLTAEDLALVELGVWLRAQSYRFVTPTPETHRRIAARPEHAETRTLVGALGWSRPFRAGALPEIVERSLRGAGALTDERGLLRSEVRFSTLDLARNEADARTPAAIYVHSAYPTSGADAVFFGPDTYRFVSLLREVVRPARRLVDVGAGTGAGGLALLDRAEQIVLGDLSPLALRRARTNVALAGGRAGGAVEVVASDVLAGVAGPIDAVIANPPYLVDTHRRLYRDGGGSLGFELSLRIVDEALARLGRGGQLVLYTGSPVIEGRHPLREALVPILARRPCRASWWEIDPDVFGEELEAPAYRSVERLAVVALVVEVT